MLGDLLTHCNHVYFGPKQVRKIQPYPPQTLLVAARLRREGRHTGFFDSTFEASEEGFRTTVGARPPELLVICEDHFNFLIKMCPMRKRELAFRMGEPAREAGIPVIAASSDVSDNIIPYLKDCADFVVLDEVEQMLAELVRNLSSRHPDPGDVPGITFRDRDTGTLRIAPKRDSIGDLDALPFRDAVRLCRALRLQTGMFLMLGNQGETVAEIEDTVQHVQNCGPDVFPTTVRYPIKGTTYYNQVGGRLAQPAFWAKSSGRDLKIRARHSRNFYQHADRLLEAEVAIAECAAGEEAALLERIAVAGARLAESFQEAEI